MSGLAALSGVLGDTPFLAAGSRCYCRVAECLAAVLRAQFPVHGICDRAWLNECLSMPLMMDHSINVDDLFGEPASIELGLSSASTKGLAQRLDEMRLLGSCRYVANPSECVYVCVLC